MYIFSTKKKILIYIASNKKLNRYNWCEWWGFFGDVFAKIYEIYFMLEMLFWTSYFH